MKKFLLLLIAAVGHGWAAYAEDPLKYAVIIHLWLPESITTPEEAEAYTSSLLLTDKEGNGLPFKVVIPSDLRKPVVLTVGNGQRPLAPSDIVIQATLTPPTHVTVADISGYTNNDAAESAAVDPVLIPGSTSSGNISPLRLPASATDGMHDEAQRITAYPNPTDGPLHVVTEGDVPFVRAYLSDQQGHILAWWAGPPSLRTFFEIRHVPAGVYYLVVQSDRSIEKRIVLKY